MGLFEPRHLEFYEIGRLGDGTVTNIGPPPNTDLLIQRWRSILARIEGDPPNNKQALLRILRFSEDPGTWTYELRDAPDMVAFLNELRILVAE